MNTTDDQKPPKGRPEKPSDASKQDRLSEALRANLRRRKAQARGRKADTASGSADKSSTS